MFLVLIVLEHMFPRQNLIAAADEHLGTLLTMICGPPVARDGPHAAAWADGTMSRLLKQDGLRTRDVRCLLDLPAGRNRAALRGVMVP